MAAEVVAGELVSFGIQKLLDLLSQECGRIQGVKDQFTGLKLDLNKLSSFLKDAYAKKYTSATVKACIEDIKEIICDGEDTIENFLLKQNLGRSSGIKMRTRRLACIIPDRRKNSSDIAAIRTRISNVIKEMQNYGVVQQLYNDGGYMQPLQDRQKEMRQTFSKENESGFVALEANVKKLVGYLVEDDNVQVVSITGMGGLGKTTLARQVFNHEDVKHQFDRLAWVCVPQEFTQISVWQTILQNLTSKERKDEILKMNEAELQGELFQLLETSKSLIVFDDIWKEEDWNRNKPIFPPTKGWKVLLTSRNESIVAPTNTKYINLKPECLTTEDSWKLFQRTIEDALKFKIDEEMEEMGKQMIKHCGGLPLAIKVLGGMLAKNYRVRDWRRLSENIGSRILRETSGNSGSTEYILSLSFEELPSHLKHCFLYLALFPEDYKIEVEKLYYYWAAEGIFRHYDGESIIRDVGDICIDELVTRNMVISEREATTMRFETCHLHDMMREICLLKAKEENFLQITYNRPPTTNFQSPVISRRFFSQNPTTLHVDRDINNPKLRSFVIVRLRNYGMGNWKLSGSSYKRLEVLRVLDLFGAEFKGRKLLSSIGKLIHLRYLSLKYATVSHLPSSLGNLKLLIYLNLDFWSGRKIFVPNVLKGMPELRYLALPWRMHEKTKLELSNLVKLESLKNFSTQSSSLEDLRGMVRLRTLKIKLYEETSMETLSASIGGLRYLETLSASMFGQRYLENLTIEDKANLMRGEWTVLDFVHLKNLSLELYMPRLSKDQQFPSHLTTLSLWHSHLEEDPMPILEKLVQLKKVILSSGSFCGRRMVCSGGGFPKLHELSLCGLEEWEEWIVEEGSMTLLRYLTIRKCPKLKELPDGLRFLYSLKELLVDEKWKERLSEGGEDYYKVQHIPSLEFIPI